MWFDIVFLSLFFAGWVLVATIPWLALSVWTRGEAGLLYLPLGWLAGVVCALLVPLLGKDDAVGLGLSFVAAFAVPCALLAARRFSLSAGADPEPAATPAHDGGRE